MPSVRRLTIDGTSIGDIEDTQVSLIERIVGDKTLALKSVQDALTAATQRAVTAETALAAETARAGKLVTDHATALATLQAQVPTGDQLEALKSVAQIARDHAAQVTALKAQIPTPEQLEAMAEERGRVVADAVVLMPGIDAKAKSLAAIRVDALAGVIAANDALKHVTIAALGGASPDKASEDVVRIAFDSIVAVKKLATPAADARGSVNDPAVAAALAGGSGNGGGGKTRLTGVDVLKYRENHGGKNPPASA